MLAGCGGGSTDTSAVGNVSRDTTISGSVGDGPIVGGNVLLLSKNGQIISNINSDAESRYTMTILANDDEFPLMARVSDGLDLVTGSRPDFPMIAAVMQPGVLNIANLNPFGTIIVRIAEKMDGGLSIGNLDRATSIVASVFSFGLDARLVADPIRTEITAENIAAVVKASEALGEVIRRTRDALISVGQSTGAGQILEALSADLVDGVLDGRGAGGADPRIAAVVNVVSAQVIVETLTNRLNVGGTDVTQSMDSAIQQIMAGEPSVALTGSVTATTQILSQARIATDAAFNLLPDASILLVRESLDRIQPGATPADALVVLPVGSSDLLDSAVLTASLATAAELEVVNSTVRQGGGNVSSGPNEPPVINGVPPTQVTVENPYSFTPTSSDPDGDQLSFAVSGKPAWLSFNPATGSLAGTPVGRR